MNDVMNSEEGADNHSRSKNLTITESEQRDTEPSQNQREDKPLIELPIYLYLEDKGVIKPLNVPARNAIVRKSPAVLKSALAEALQRQTNKEGVYEGIDCVVCWKQSQIPFHIEFSVSDLVSNKTCQHLAFIRNIKAKDTDQYAKYLVPLAKIFLSTQPGSHLPHLPFTWSQITHDSRSRDNALDKKTTETIQHARLINNRHNSLTEIDLETAETVGKMVNAGKIFSGLLVYLTTPKPRLSDAAMSTESPTTDDTRFQSTERHVPAALKRPKPVSAQDLQAFGPGMDQNQAASNPRRDIDGVREPENPNFGEDSAPGNTSAAETSLPEELAVAMRSPKRGKASEKNNKRKKQNINKRTRNEAVSNIGAYPTQRPPRRKPARKSITIKDFSDNDRLGPEDCESGKIPATQLPPLEGSHQGNQTPEKCLSPNNASQDDCVSSESTSREYESNAHTSEEVIDAELAASDVGFTSSDIVQNDDLTATADEPIPFSLSRGLLQTNGSGVQGLLWAYRINTYIDENLEDAGIWLWRKPKTNYHTQSLLRTERFGHSILAPVLVSQERTGNDEPLIEFDGDTVHVVPHKQPWDDVRSHESHPDFLIPWKLAEYQASEAAGYEIWRHDRDLLLCRKSGCGITISDYHHFAIVCLGCGPKSFIRYCSLQHQLEDIEGHWKECGTSGIILERVIDQTTAPSKFARTYPAIKPRNGSRTAALHRQMLYCALTYGHYTLFDSGSKRCETLCWPKQDPKWPEMDRRVERLLNIAFLDGWNHLILGYLFRLLRELLRSRGQWFQGTERALVSQFEAEFSDYRVNTNFRNGDAPCQCEWSGKVLPRYDHLSTCWEFASAAGDYRPLRCQRCIEATVRDYEDRFWILRAWRQQHPTQNNWRLRAAGYGFPGIVPDEGCYELGPGWTGWGGEEDNIREDQRDEEWKRSMLLA